MVLKEAFCTPLGTFHTPSKKVYGKFLIRTFLQIILETR